MVDISTLQSKSSRGGPSTKVTDKKLLLTRRFAAAAMILIIGGASLCREGKSYISMYSSSSATSLNINSNSSAISRVLLVEPAENHDGDSVRCASDKSPQHVLNSYLSTGGNFNIQYLDTEAALQAAHPTNFLPLPSFDHDIPEPAFPTSHVTGGIAHFDSALVVGEKPPTIYFTSCFSYGIRTPFSPYLYVPSGCKSQEGSVHSLFNPTISLWEGQKDNLIWLTGGGDTKSVITIFIWQYWGDSYYHALVEVLPRLAYVLPYIQQYNRESNSNSNHLHGTKKLTVNILGFNLNYNNEDKEETNKEGLLQLQSLFSDILGLSNTDNINVKWIPYNTQKAYLISNLVVPTGTRCGRGQPKAIEALQQVFDTTIPKVLKTEIDKLHQRYNIIVPNNTNDRKKENKKQLVIVLQVRLHDRKVLNTNELYSRLQHRFGNSQSSASSSASSSATTTTTIIQFFGNETIHETMAIHHMADIVIGPHGAGLANLIFCKRNVEVVELHPKYGNFGPKGESGMSEEVNVCHEYTARAAGLGYTLIRSSSSTSTTTTGDGKEEGGVTNSFYADFEADIPKVLEVVENIISKK